MKIFMSGARGFAVALVGAGALAATSCGEVQGTPENTAAQVSANDPVSAPGAAGEQELRRTANDVANLLDDDVVPPTVELTSPALDSFLRGTVALTADASDDVGVARVDFLLDGATVIGTATQAPYTVNWNTTATSGPHSLTAQAFDAAGNPGTSSAVSVLVDNHVPIILIGPPQYNPSNQNYVRGIVNVGWAVTDQSLSGVAYVEFLQNGAWMGSTSGLPDASTYYYSWDTRVLGNRSYTLTLRATDNAGNVQTSTRNLIVDNALPSVNLVAPANGTQVSGVVTLTAYAGDSQALLYVRFEVDGEMLTPFSTSSPFTKTWDTTGKSGTHQIVAIAVDRAGNSKRSNVATVTVP
ncbi:Ig-like domain-containing protein [Corallococcus sicarius]|nr:Ig-like domain-containing protein [Corallococcus sicarius]